MASNQFVYVKCDDKTFRIGINEDTTVEDIKKDVFALTGVQVPQQKIININFRGLDENRCGLRHIKQLHPFELSPLILVIEKIYISCYASMKIRSRFFNGGFENRLISRLERDGIRIINLPPKHNRLLVLNTDYTLYDSSVFYTVDRYLGIRPHLHHFLQNVYKYYDIILWSNTAMDEIEMKVTILGVTENTSYKIMGFMNHTACRYVNMPGGQFKKVKLLSTIWKRFRHYNYNTILCDVEKEDISLNCKNGILVKKYSYLRENSDMELVYLKEYLIYLARNDDDLMCSGHNRWRKRFVTN